MNQALYALRSNRPTQVLSLLLLFMGTAVTRSVASLKRLSPTTQQTTYCGKPCSTASQCGGSCKICTTGTCHY